MKMLVERKVKMKKIAVLFLTLLACKSYATITYFAISNSPREVRQILNSNFLELASGTTTGTVTNAVINLVGTNGVSVSGTQGGTYTAALDVAYTTNWTTNTDYRLSDSRTPLTHSHTYTVVTNVPATWTNDTISVVQGVGTTTNISGNLMTYTVAGGSSTNTVANMVGTNGVDVLGTQGGTYTAKLNTAYMTNWVTNTDYRLSDSRTPVTHSHTYTVITNVPTAWTNDSVSVVNGVGVTTNVSGNLATYTIPSAGAGTLTTNSFTGSGVTWSSTGGVMHAYAAGGNMSALSNGLISVGATASNAVKISGETRVVTLETNLMVNGTMLLNRGGLNGATGEQMLFSAPTVSETYRHILRTSHSSTLELGYMQFGIANGMSTYNDVLYLNGDGSVAIGCTNRNGGLYVKGNAQATGTVTAATFAGSGAGLTFPSSVLPTALACTPTVTIVYASSTPCSLIVTSSVCTIMMGTDTNNWSTNHIGRVDLSLWIGTNTVTWGSNIVTEGTFVLSATNGNGVLLRKDAFSSTWRARK